jgi:PhnB protein
MHLNTYVTFSGKCAEAFRYYEKHLGAKVGMEMTHAQSPRPTPVSPEWKDAVLHARISIGGTEVWAADIPNAERVFSALSDGGQVLMPIREEFFATRFGQLRDRFGINWTILHERPTPSRT